MGKAQSEDLMKVNMKQNSVVQLKTFSKRVNNDYHAASTLLHFKHGITKEALCRRTKTDPKRRWISREKHRQFKLVNTTGLRLLKTESSQNYIFILPSSRKPITVVSKIEREMKYSSSQKSSKNQGNKKRKTLYMQESNPVVRLHDILKHETGMLIETRAALELRDFFLTMTNENVSAYNSDIVTAVRQRDVKKLSEIHENGGATKLQCCNRFGESILHKACRYGATAVVRFLVKEAKISIRVRDDYGRTPLHDAFWTPKPEMELVKILIETCPDLLLVEDVRGCTPLTYTRKEHWGIWCQFLEANRNILTPTIIASNKQ